MYSILLVPFGAMFGAQFLKIIIEAFQGKFSWGDLNRYGGWPSGHSAGVAALVAQSVELYGWSSPVVAVSLMFAFLAIRDAVGFRQELGHHAQILNKLITELPDHKEALYPHLSERWGHTYGQALSGIVFGVLFAIVF